MTVDRRVHSLLEDIGLAYIAYIFSYLIAIVLLLAGILAVGYEPGFVVLVVVLIVIFLHYHSSSRSRSVARSIGASAGWLFFALVWPKAFLVGHFWQERNTTGAYSLLLAGMIALGIVVADQVWAAWRKHVAQAKQSV